MALYIFSDAHLGSGSPDQEAAKVANIAALCELVKDDGDRLIILGDLFDFWFEYRHVVPKAHYDILFRLHELRNRGIKIDYISGNHDFWMGDFFARHLHIDVHTDNLALTYAGKRIYMCHGDGLAQADRGYRALKKVLRSPLSIRLYRLLSPDWAYPLAKYVSGSSRKYTARRDHKFAADYARFAQAKLSEGFDVVIIGHLHIPVYQQFDAGTYINTGDFIHHFTYAKIDGGHAVLEHLE